MKIVIKNPMESPLKKCKVKKKNTATSKNWGEWTTLYRVDEWISKQKQTRHDMPTAHILPTLISSIVVNKSHQLVHTCVPLRVHTINTWANANQLEFLARFEMNTTNHSITFAFTICIHIKSMPTANWNTTWKKKQILSFKFHTAQIYKIIADYARSFHFGVV